MPINAHFIMAALCSRCGHSFFPVVSIFFPRLISAAGTWCGLRANLDCRSEMCCKRLAANTRGKKSPSAHHRTTLSGCIFVTKASEKSSLHSNISPTRPYNMENFCPLTAEICWRVWGTQANLNGFRVLAALLHGSPVLGVSQTLRR